MYLFNAVQNEAGDVDEKQVAAVMLRRLMANDFIDFFSNVNILLITCTYFNFVITDIIL